MNKELILKYHKEFDYWLHGGKLLVCNIHEKHWIKLTEQHWSDGLITTRIIINDGYVEFRKALAEGKQLEYNSDTDYPVTQGGGWKQYTNDVFTKPTNCYRIKPEEPKFKVGDWVRNKANPEYIDIIVGIDSRGNYIVDRSEYYILGSDNAIKWEPQAGELCWFALDYEKDFVILSKFPSHSANSNIRVMYDQYPICEPFLNSKPSWFKD